MTEQARSAQQEPMETSSAPWRRYPFDLVSGDSQFRFPAAETVHSECQSDTWFLAGQLTASSGRRFAFLTIFNRNRPADTIVADFHTMALFDLDHGTYGTYTDYDMPPKNMAPDAEAKLAVTPGHLDMSYAGSAGTAVWRACRDDGGDLVPYTYAVTLFGTDQEGRTMELRLDVSPTTAPVPVGASTYGGRFACMGQAETFSYFQTGMSMSGSMTWGEITEQVSGTAGHIDRQWFPVPPGGNAAGEPNAIAHEWRTIHLDNGFDIVGWRQFDRNDRNALVPFTGATVTSPDMPPRCVEDLEVHTTSYVRWPESVRQLIRPQAAGRYVPDRHTLRSAELDLDLTGEPLVPLPAHALPVEYMEGPFVFHGTMAGRPVRGFGISERSLALHRDWELAEVLAVTAEYARAGGDVKAGIAALDAMVAEGRGSDARDHLRSVIRPAVAVDLANGGFGLGQMLDDLETALSGAQEPSVSP